MTKILRGNLIEGFNGRPMGQQNNAFRSQQQGNEKRSKPGYRSSILENVRSEIVQLSNMENDDDGYVYMQRSIKSLQLLCDSGANVSFEQLVA